MATADWVLVVITGAAAVALTAYTFGRVHGDDEHENDWKNGWAAGIDYERQRNGE